MMFHCWNCKFRVCATHMLLYFFNKEEKGKGMTSLGSNGRLFCLIDIFVEQQRNWETAAAAAAAVPETNSISQNDHVWSETSTRQQEVTRDKVYMSSLSVCFQTCQQRATQAYFSNQQKQDSRHRQYQFFKINTNTSNRH